LGRCYGPLGHFQDPVFTQSTRPVSPFRHLGWAREAGRADRGTAAPRDPRWVAQGRRPHPIHPGPRPQLEVSRRVVVDAYSQLAAEGYLELRQGARPRVSEAAMPRENTATEPAFRLPSRGSTFGLERRTCRASRTARGCPRCAMRSRRSRMRISSMGIQAASPHRAPRGGYVGRVRGVAAVKELADAIHVARTEGAHGRTFCLGRGFAAKRRGSTVAHTDRPERQQAADRAMRHYRGDVHQLLRRSADRGARREPRSRMDAAASNPGAAYRAPGQRGNDYADRCGEGIGAGVAGRGATREPGAAPQCTRKARREVESRHPENAGTIDDQGSRRAREHRRT
jgi:hypothetical protein